MQPFFSYLFNALEKGISISYATILSTKGSAPQVPGASAIFSPQGLFYGTLGGGVMEGEIEKKALIGLKDKSDTLLNFDLNSTIEDDSGPICGGYATILIDANPEASIEEFRKLMTSLESDKPGVLISLIDKNSDKNQKIKRYWYAEKRLEEPTLPTDIQNLKKNLKKALDEGKSLLEEDQKKGRLIYYQPVFPDPRLVIVGAGHIGKALSHFGKLLDFQVTVIDDRPEHANKTNIPDADHILSNDVENDVRSLNITENTYVVIVTQGHKKDAIALKNCIHSKAAYIGMIGSRRKTRLMKEDFVEKGWATKEELENIYAPIGIDIHSKTVQEIAISIAGQLVKVRREKDFMKKGRDVEIIILAAGKSERMGQQKLLMPVNEVTIIENIVKKALESHAGEVIVVIGSHKEKISKILQKYPVKTVFNPDYETGMLSSVQSGFNALSTSAKAGMLLLGDQPMVQISTINKLIETYHRSGKGMVIPVFKGKRGHPALIDKTYVSLINALNPEIGLRQLMEENKGDIQEVEVETNTILKDIDTIEDYKKELT